MIRRRGESTLSPATFTSDSHAPITLRGGRGKEYLLASFIGLTRASMAAVASSTEIMPSCRFKKAGIIVSVRHERAPAVPGSVHAIRSTCFMAFDADSRSFAGETLRIAAAIPLGPPLGNVLLKIPARRLTPTYKVPSVIRNFETFGDRGRFDGGFSLTIKALVVVSEIAELGFRETP